MTKEEIRDLMPGSDMDRLVAQKVMGGEATSGVPEYSTDLKAAWEVLGRFEWVSLLKGGVGMWTCTLRLYQGIAFKEYQALSRQAPEAICKAALFAALADNKDR